MPKCSKPVDRCVPGRCSFITGAFFISTSSYLFPLCHIIVIFKQIFKLRKAAEPGLVLTYPDTMSANLTPLIHWDSWSAHEIKDGHNRSGRAFKRDGTAGGVFLGAGDLLP